MNPESFFRSELAAWPVAAENFRNLEKASAQAVSLTDSEPWRIRKLLVSHRRASITAKTDPQSIAARPCFLCEANRPPEQSAITAHGFQTLVNPYPLAWRHYTIASERHEPQRISGRLQEMARLTREFRDLCVFYNGPLCGASAPDHLHFQAISTEVAAGLTDPRLPLETIDSSDGCKLLRSVSGAVPYPFFIIDSTDTAALALCTSRLLDSLPQAEPEPMVNVAMIILPDGRLRTFIAPRRRHRPAVYGSGPGQMLISPATIEMLGTIVCSRPEDFERLDLATATAILSEVGLDEQQFAATIHLYQQLNTPQQ